MLLEQKRLFPKKTVKPTSVCKDPRTDRKMRGIYRKIQVSIVFVDEVMRGRNEVFDAALLGMLCNLLERIWFIQSEISEHLPIQTNVVLSDRAHKPRISDIMLSRCCSDSIIP